MQWIYNHFHTHKLSRTSCATKITPIPIYLSREREITTKEEAFPFCLNHLHRHTHKARGMKGRRGRERVVIALYRRKMRGCRFSRKEKYNNPGARERRRRKHSRDNREQLTKSTKKRERERVTLVKKCDDEEGRKQQRRQ